MRYEHVLAGCTPTPLAHYLKALGVLRLIAEQRDPQVAGRWRGEEFVLHTVLDRDELDRFFLFQYKPTPLVAPWNGGSGFYPGDNKSGIDAIASANTKRLKPFADVIALAKDCVGSREESPRNEEKSAFLCDIRGRLPDDVLIWFDAAVLLTTEKPGYPPLLGTGGNDGRLDFTNNFMQRITELFDMVEGRPAEKATDWLTGALTGKAASGLLSKAVGQFAPGNAGGANASTGFEGVSLVNPWDFILMLEGALLFAGSSTRRLQSGDPSTLSYPFTVRTTGAGTGAGNLADEGHSRAEMWMPLWGNTLNVQELRALLSEGRATVGKRAARDALDFARAVAARCLGTGPEGGRGVRH